MNFVSTFGQFFTKPCCQNTATANSRITTDADFQLPFACHIKNVERSGSIAPANQRQLDHLETIPSHNQRQPVIHSSVPAQFEVPRNFAFPFAKHAPALPQSTWQQFSARKYQLLWAKYRVTRLLS